MRASDLLSAAYAMGMASDKELRERWKTLSHKFASIAAPVQMIAVQQIGHLDLLLRLIESERLERMNCGDRDEEPFWMLSVQRSLSDGWLMSAYEAARAAKEHVKGRGQEMPKLISLEYRLALVRMPVAKGKIQGMHKRANRDNPPMLAKVGDDGSPPETYRDDGSFIMPTGTCGTTGAIVWYPVDMSTRETVGICRRDLSDEMLALFD